MPILSCFINQKIKLASKSKGANTNELRLTVSFFEDLVKEGAVFFKVSFSMAGGRVFQLFKTNQIPRDGSCAIDKAFGLSSLTYFTVNCTGWTDPDGSIVSYELYSTFLNSQHSSLLIYNQNGQFSLKLPVGPSYDSFKISLFLFIIDDVGGTTTYQLSSQIRTLPSAQFALSIIKEMNKVFSSSLPDTGAPQNPMIQTFLAQNLNSASEFLSSFLSEVNYMSQNVITQVLRLIYHNSFK